MGFYSQVIFPRLCELALGSSIVAARRKELLEGAGGEVLEIGLGTGLNLPHYPSQVHKLVAIEPSAGMGRLARKRIAEAPFPMELHRLQGENLPFADARFDAVVSTFTLCSVGHVEQVLGEAVRVLKPGGKFLFLEHGLSPDAGVQAWQFRLDWLQVRLGDGCHLTRDVRAMMAVLPLTSLAVDASYVPRTPKTHGYVYQGVGVK